MADRKRKEFEAWATKELAKIQKMLLLTDYELNPIRPSKQDETSTSAFNYPYKEIDIEYSENIYRKWCEGDKRRAWSVLLHEMLHPVTDKLYAVGFDRWSSRSQMENEREQLTDHLANVIIQLTYDRDRK